MLQKFQQFYEAHYYKIIITLAIILWTTLVFLLGFTFGALQKEEEVLFKTPPGTEAELGPDFFKQMEQKWQKADQSSR